ncbi:hypothetical protein GGX14DRAFT_562716 [Mycena pura]|uniref:Uncharacterized protein n=1 Tax=Mycena pura TaxID=153505 RepID=A0AAD6VP99_9AGAR|nr:hypothetical protein GGX14DRAFT_562716 [Mycena pura]
MVVASIAPPLLCPPSTSRSPALFACPSCATARCLLPAVCGAAKDPARCCTLPRPLAPPVARCTPPVARARRQSLAPAACCLSRCLRRAKTLSSLLLRLHVAHYTPVLAPAGSFLTLGSFLTPCTAAARNRHAPTACAGPLSTPHAAGAPAHAPRSILLARARSGHPAPPPLRSAPRTLLRACAGSLSTSHVCAGLFLTPRAATLHRPALVIDTRRPRCPLTPRATALHCSRTLPWACAGSCPPAHMGACVGSFSIPDVCTRFDTRRRRALDSNAQRGGAVTLCDAASGLRQHEDLRPARGGQLSMMPPASWRPWSA